ncbi:MAG: serine/threonine protein kinase [Planctomycetes bacterium]|nr:serine/threonine protein kinase [Planctomycetota bacterium]
MELAASWKPEPGENVSTQAPRPAPPPEPGELAPLFPELELESLLGAGGMGAVYKAKQKRLGRAVALKVLHGELSGDPLFVERFLREAQALAKLAHPGIVAIHDFGEREKRCYLVMEYVDGTNLRTLLKQGLLAPRQALDIVRQLCDALQFAHDEGVVHRDIKPENVLVDTAGRVKIADFGLAKLVGGPAQLSLTSANQVMGTPHYMAPEQVEHPRDVDHRADLYSLGVVFYEMLTGELPLGRFQAPSERVQIDVRLDEIVMKSLARERERRYQHAVQVKTDVERVEREPQAPSKKKREKLVLKNGLYLPRLSGGVWANYRPWLLISFAVWIACAASFDLGPFGFGFVSVPLLTWLFFGYANTSLAAEPAGPGRGRWIFHVNLGAAALFVLGLGALLTAHVAWWERWTPGYVSSPQAPMTAVQGWSGREGELLSALDSVAASAGTTPTDGHLVVQSSHWLTFPNALFEVQPLLLVLAALAFLCVSAYWFLHTRGVPPEECGARLRKAILLFLFPLASLDLLTTSLGILEASKAPTQFTIATSGDSGDEARKALETAMAASDQGALQAPVTLPCAGSADDLGARLYSGLVERALQVHAEHSAEIVDAHGTVLAHLHVLAAAPASPFDRWRLGWNGPQRLRPHVIYTVATDAQGKNALVHFDWGKGARPVVFNWRLEIDELLRNVCR